MEVFKKEFAALGQNGGASGRVHHSVTTHVVDVLDPRQWPQLCLYARTGRLVEWGEYRDE
ncbi:hypothetical protein [Georgenia ruanii]|uniref:hypothetical protein n=1 Tax=Georgenia ruanii TaxID=348442 RepID=UPI001D013A11|nr:hypothetical protein [Georgenia ruanii]